MGAVVTAPSQRIKEVSYVMLDRAREEAENRATHWPGNVEKCQDQFQY